MKICGMGVLLAEGISLRSAAGTTFAMNVATPGISLRFLPQKAYACLRSMTGPALTTAPAFRSGTNGAHNNLTPIVNVPIGIAVGTLAEIPLASPLIIPSLAQVVLVELTTQAIGPTTMVGDVLVQGLLVE